MQTHSPNVTISRTIFLEDDTLLSADSEGYFTLWAPVMSEDGQLEFMQSTFQGHMVCKHSCSWKQ